MRLQKLKISINGFGRIGRCVLRVLYERQLQNAIEVVAINELADGDTMAYMLRYDSTHGRFSREVSVANDVLTIDGKHIRMLHHNSIEQLPWSELHVDMVLECTGQFKSCDELKMHLNRGAKKVLLSQPGVDVDFTLVAGLNQDLLQPHHDIVSVGSCSTNCILPVFSLLDEKFGIEQGVTTTIHSAMNDQPVIDAYGSDLRRTRAAVASIIPVDTALPRGISRLMPHLDGRIESLHLRVPTLNVSVMDLSLQLKEDVTAEQVNTLFEEASAGFLKNITGFTREPHASVDFNHDARSGIVDASQTRVSGKRLLKMLVWFDNEWGFANRMVDALQNTQLVSGLEK
jgi:D-erythrose 4-phosphate dehydrogenase